MPCFVDRATRAEKDRGLIWINTYRDAITEADNNGTLAGNAYVREGLILDGAGDYAQYAGMREIISKISAESTVIEFTPSFAANDGSSRTWWFTATPAQWFVQKNAANAIIWGTSGSTRLTVALASYQAYWKTNQRNVLVITSTGALNGCNAWLNGVQVASATGSAWSAGPLATGNLAVGANSAGTEPFAGIIHSVRIFGAALDSDEALAYSDNSMFHWRDKPWMVYQLGLSEYEGDYTGGNDNILHATYGVDPTGPQAMQMLSYFPPGVVPVKLTPRGYYFDGTCGFNGGGNLGHWPSMGSVTMMAAFKPDFAAAAASNRYILDTDAGADYALRHLNTANLSVRMGGTEVFAIASGTYGPYWQQGCRNTIVAAGTTGANRLLLNGMYYMTSATAWAGAAVTYDSIGINGACNGGYWLGDIYTVAVFPARLNRIQMIDAHHWLSNAAYLNQRG